MERIASAVLRDQNLGGEWSLEKLERCIFKRVTIEADRLEGAEFDRCQFYATAFHVDRFENCVFVGAAFAEPDSSESCLFRGTTFRQCTFTGCDLTAVRFERCNLSSCRFEGCLLSDVVFQKSAFHRSVSRDVDVCQFELIDSVCVNLDFSRSILTGADFSGSQFQGCDFTESSLVRLRARRALFEDCSLRDADLEHADLCGAELQGSYVGDARSLAGMRIFDTQTRALLKNLGVTVVRNWDE